jgi:predicted exporter
MTTLLVKVLLTAVLVVAISELGKRSSFAGALLASLPLTSLLALIWLYHDTSDATQAAELARGIFWLVLPSLAFFVVFPAGVRAGWGFWPAMGVGVVATLAAYAAMLGVDRIFQLKLFG